MDRRHFLLTLSAVAASNWLPISVAQAKTFMTVAQAQEALLPGIVLQSVTLTLTPEQVQKIEASSEVRVRQPHLSLWRSAQNHWFIVDQVIGKHENIDWALALDRDGKVLGMEIITYRETYGHQVRNPVWQQQFHGKDPQQHFTVDDNIQNISGATLSCVHLTEGVNRLLQTWQWALREL